MKTPSSLDQRSTKRIESQKGIAITPNGICKIINISNEGVALKCIDEQGFPSDWTMDIYDVVGRSLDQLRVKKVWEKWISSTQPVSFSIEVGGCFNQLSSIQKAQISRYLRELADEEKHGQLNI